MLTKANIPVGKSWVWEVSKFTLSDQDAQMFNLRQLVNGRESRNILPWEYTKLTVKGQVMMSDTLAELNDHTDFYNKAKWKVLIAWLWLWVIWNAVANKSEVTEVVIIEKSRDVIKLVWPYMHEKVKVIHSDIFKYNTSEIFDYWWYDIWLSISTNNLKAFEKLRKQFGSNIKDIWF